MKHLKLFEDFQENIKNSDVDAIKKILAVSHESWFIKGEDAPEEFIKSLEDFESDNVFINNAVKVSASGPGYTDVFLEADMLISDAISEDPDLDEKDIEDSNRNWFADERKMSLEDLKNFYHLLDPGFKRVI